jgi:Multidrug resistance efflux pump
MNAIKNFSEDTVETLWAPKSTGSQIIYIVVLVATFIAGILCFFIKVPITIQAEGIIRPLSERTDIKSAVSGRLTEINVKEGDFVNIGDTLFKIDSDKIDLSIEEITIELEKQTEYIADLNILLRRSRGGVSSALYRSQNASYINKYAELETRETTAKKSYARATTLYEKSVIALTEMEREEQSYTTAKNEKSLFISEQRAKWEDDLNRYQISIRELGNRLDQFKKDATLYAVLSPIEGTVAQFSGTYIGSFVSVGNSLAIISPDTDLQVESFVHPKDIGYIRMHDTARIQVDAFPYAEWGVLTGRTVEISDDYLLVNDTPMFRVRTLLDRDRLYLKNGFEGKVKKGMTVKARFPVTERTLYQLLFDKINEWLNPAHNTVSSG